MTRAETIAWITKQLDYEAGITLEQKAAWHYGKVELAQLVSKLYPDEPPVVPKDFQTKRGLYNRQE